MKRQPHSEGLDTRAESTDVSRLLAIGSRGARIIAAVYIVANVVFTFATISTVASPWPSVIAMFAVNGAAILLVRYHRDPFPLQDTLLVIATVMLSTALISWQLPLEGPTGRAAWHFGSNTWLLFFLALRHRALMAWLGFGLMTAITLVWTVTTGRGAGDGIGMLQMHAGILLVATLFASNLRRTSRRINDLNERSVEAAASYAATDAAQEIRRQRVAELATAVVPVLTRLAEGDPISDQQRHEYRAIEATLRDGVRGRSLAVPSVVSATRAARLRGVEVNLLDDRGTVIKDGAAMSRMVDQVVDALNAVNEGTITVRLGPEGRDVALSIVTTFADDTQRLELDEQGMQILERESV